MLQPRRAECSETLHRTSNYEYVQTVKSYVGEERVFVFSPIHVATENGWAMANLFFGLSASFQDASQCKT